MKCFRYSNTGLHDFCIFIFNSEFFHPLLYLFFPSSHTVLTFHLLTAEMEEQLIFTLGSFFPTTPRRTWYLKPMSHSSVTLLVSRETNFQTLRVLFFYADNVVLHVTWNLHVITVSSLIQQASTETLRLEILTRESKEVGTISHKHKTCTCI